MPYEGKTMNKLALVSGAVLALSLLSAPAAFADDNDCDEARKVLVQAQTRLANRAAEERVEELAELDAAKGVLRAAQTALDEAAEGVDLEPLRKAVRDARALRDAAQKALDTDSRRLVELRAAVTVAIQERDKACDEPDPTPTTTPPAPTTPVDTDVDCDEVTDARAQEILDADRNDPNNLDDDNDGVACEEDDVLRPQVVTVPVGGVATGGGPA
jgi:hypothetical protein